MTVLYTCPKCDCPLVVIHVNLFKAKCLSCYPNIIGKGVTMREAADDFNWQVINEVNYGNDS